jgi:hypothetical protein
VRRLLRSSTLAWSRFLCCRSSGHQIAPNAGAEYLVSVHISPGSEGILPS